MSRALPRGHCCKSEEIEVTSADIEGRLVASENSRRRKPSRRFGDVSSTLAASDQVGFPPPPQQGWSGDEPPKRLPPRTKPPFQSVLILILAFGSGLLLMFGLPNLMPETGITAIMKTAVIAAGATVVAYGVNRLAVERGAPLAGVGYRSALFGSTVAIAVVGSGMFASTYSGLTMPQVSRLALEAHGVDLGVYVGSREQAAQQAGRIAPAVAAIASDLSSRIDCASRPACAGLRRNERVATRRALSEKLARAESVAAAADAGRTRQQNASRRLGELLGLYQTIVRSSDKGVAETWVGAQKIDTEIRQAIADLMEASPVALVRAYADEIASSADEELRARGASLKAVAESAAAQGPAAPVFPAPPGVGQTFGYILHFLPIAVIAAVIDLVVPLLLWLYAYLSLRWAMHRASPPSPRDPDDHEDALKHFIAGRDPVTRAPLSAPSGGWRGPGDPRPNGLYRGR